MARKNDPRLACIMYHKILNMYWYIKNTEKERHVNLIIDIMAGLQFQQSVVNWNKHIKDTIIKNRNFFIRLYIYIYNNPLWTHVHKSTTFSSMGMLLDRVTPIFAVIEFLYLQVLHHKNNVKKQGRINISFLVYSPNIC